MTRIKRRQVGWNWMLVHMLLLLLLVSGPGCSSVLTVEPIGLDPVALTPEDWDGRWGATAAECNAPKRGEEEPLRVVDAQAGILEWPERDGKVWTFYLRSSPRAGLLFATIREGEQEGLAWGLVRKTEDGALIVWVPAAAAFDREIREGRLAGIPGDSPTLFPQPEEALRRIVTVDDSGLIPWDEPGILVRCPTNGSAP